MANEEGKKVFKLLCSMLDSIGWTYDKMEEKLAIETSARGDDFPIHIRIGIDDDHKRQEGAVCAGAANYRIVDGAFDYDVRDGQILYRQNVCYRDAVISEETLKYLLNCACSTVDQYNDKMFMVAKGVLPLTDYINWAYGDQN